MLDLSCVLLSAPLWLPFVTLVWLWISLVSGGPILFRQERVGHRGRRFAIYKFRSMEANVETHSHENHLKRLMNSEEPLTKLDAFGDPRVIPGGRLMRATGLDELPQILNVIRGEMSLVGPRPCTPREFEDYQESQKERFTVLPGLTGYWQVNGKNTTTFKQMLEMDGYYARHSSPWLDLEIMARTIPAILRQLRRRPRIVKEKETTLAGSRTSKITN